MQWDELGFRACATNHADRVRIGCPRLQNGAQLNKAPIMVRPVDSSAPTPNPAELVQQVAAELQNMKPLSEQAWAAASSSIGAAAALPSGADDGRHAIQVQTRANQASDEIASEQATESDLTSKFNTLANLQANGQIDSGTESKIAQLAKEFGGKVDSEYAGLDNVRLDHPSSGGSYTPQIDDTAQQLWRTQAPLTGGADAAWHAAAPRAFMNETHDQFDKQLTDLIGTGYDNHGAINRDVGQIVFTTSGNGDQPNPDPVAMQQFKQDASALQQLEKKLSDHFNAATDLSGLEPGSDAQNHAAGEVKWAQEQFSRINAEVSKVDDASSKVSTTPWNGDMPWLITAFPGLE